MRKKLLSLILSCSMFLSVFVGMPTAAHAVPVAYSPVFTDGDLDQVYFAGDTLSFNFTGIPVGTPPTGLPAGTNILVSFGTLSESGDFTAENIYTSGLTDGTADGLGYYTTRTLQGDGSLSSAISGTISEYLDNGVVAVKLYYYDGSSWQNVLTGQSPDYIPLTYGSDPAIVGIDSLLLMPGGVTSEPVLGEGSQSSEDLRNMDICFTKTISSGITGSISFEGLNIIDNSAELTGLDAGLIMEAVNVPADGTSEQYTLGVDVSPEALEFLAGIGADISVTSSSFDGMTTEDFSAEAADITGGTISELTFDDATDTVSFTVDHFSNYLLSILGDNPLVGYAWVAYDQGIPTGPAKIHIPDGPVESIKYVDFSSVWMSGGDFVEDQWYTVSYSDSDSGLYIIDEETGDYTLVGQTGAPLYGLAYDSQTGITYVNNANNLYTIDLNTAALTLVGPMDYSLVIAISSDGNGNMYGLDIGSDVLFSINKTTGYCTLIGSTGLDLNYAQDMAYDRDNNKLYGVLYDLGGNPGLYSIDTATGAATLEYACSSELDAFAIPYTSSGTDDMTAPVLSGGAVERTSDSEATVSFTSDESGEYYYSIVSDDDPAPEINTDGAGIICDTTEQTIVLDTLTAGAKDIYIVVKDADGNVSEPLQLDIDAYVMPFWTDNITAMDQYPFDGGDGSSETEAYEISTAEQLAQLAYNLNNGAYYTGKYFKMTADIDLSGKQWVPIGYNYSTSFKGSFDGNGHSIEGLTITRTSGADAYGLFGFLNAGCIIQGITIESGIISFDENAGYGYFGGITGYSYGLVKDCINKADILINYSDWTYAGGIVGLGNCDTWSYSSTASISGCHNEGNIEISYSGSVGGIIGNQMNSTSATYIDQCSNSGNITGGKYGEAGGIAGRIDNAGTIGIINCYNNGNVNSGASDSSSAYAGGIVGYQYYSQVKNCYNTGTVSLIYYSNGNAHAGGISAYSDGNIKNCYNVGNVYSTGRGGEGITGSYSNCENCYYLDTTTSTSPISGMTSLTAEQMQGLEDSTITFNYAGNSTTYGPASGALLYALNYGRYTSSSYPDGYMSWASDEDGINNGYPVLSTTQYSYIVSFESNGGTAVAAETVESGNSIAVAPTTTLNGSSFNGWFTAASGGTKVAFPYLPSADTILYAQWKTSGGGGSSSGPSILVTTEQNGNSTTNSTEIEGNISSGAASVNINGSIITALLDKAKETDGENTEDLLEVAIDTHDTFNKLQVTIPQKEFEKIVAETEAGFAITSSFINITFDSKALETITAADSNSNIQITAELAGTKNGRPVYELTVMNGETKVTHFGGGCAAVSIPYELKSGENPLAIVIYYLADDDSLKVVKGKYDAELGAVVFQTTHFSEFMIEHTPVSFIDVKTGAWYKDAIDFIAARGITSGTGNNKYSPEAQVTRAQFVVLLMNAYQIEVHSSVEDLQQLQNFADAGNTYYTDYLLTAKELGIVSGMGNNLFAPGKEITRQEMFIMLYNALTVLGEIPTAVNNKQLSSFSDADQLAQWAEKATTALIKGNIVTGNNNMLNPTVSATRAEIAQMLYNLLAK